MQWFIKEQVEEVAIDVRPAARRRARRSDNPLLAEEYLARDGAAPDRADPTAPPTAGGAL